MAAPASGVDPPTHPPRGNKRKKGRKLRSRAEGGRSACVGVPRERGDERGDRGRTMWDGEKRREEGEGENGDGYPRGKQFLLIQRSHPHGGASLVDPLLDLSPSRSVSLSSFLSRSRVVLLSFTLSLSLSSSCLSFPLGLSLSFSLPFSVFLSAREPGFCEQVLLRLPPSTVICRILSFTPSRSVTP